MKCSPLDLPRIAVVGSQSAGKSSVLENIVGQSFLPRGNGLVTRCPCEIRMHRSECESYGMFASAEDSSKKYTDFNDIKAKIESETMRICGPRGLSPQPILLDIYSPDVVDLTLVDLPGAVRTVIEGQDPATPARIREMILDYIKNENVIILAVNAANNDLANSDAIAYSREVDPQGQRTLGVLTKLDMMEDGTDARGIVTGEDRPPTLELGYIGVVNRSKAQNDEGVSMSDARDAEMRFFTSNAAYRTLAAKMGTSYLVERCSMLLLQSIQRELPKIDGKVKELIDRKRVELQDLPEITDQTKRDNYGDIAVKFCNNFEGIIDGKVSVMDNPSELQGGARMKRLFELYYKQKIMEIGDANALQVDQQIRVSIYNRNGFTGGLYQPSTVFEDLVRGQVELLKDPSIELAEDILSEMRKIQEKACMSVGKLSNFPEARASINQKCNAILQKHHVKCLEHIETYVRMQQGRISYDHDEFDRDRIQFEIEIRRYGSEDSEEDMQLLQRSKNGGSLTKEERLRLREIAQRRQRSKEAHRAGERSDVAGGSGGGTTSLAGVPMPPRLGRSVSAKVPALDRPTDREELEIEKLKALTRAYFGIIQRQTVDMVPKYIGLLQVNDCMKKISKEIKYGLAEEEILALMAPSEEMQAKRAETLEGLEKLQEAEKMLNEIQCLETNLPQGRR
jgi:GTPase SAR1 family protein